MKISRLVLSLACILAILTGCGRYLTTSKENRKVKSHAEYNVATFNIRYDAPDPGDRNWKIRQPLIKDIIQKYEFDIVGLQEAQGPRLDELKADLPSFGSVGVGRKGYASEHSAILYKSNRFSVLDSGTFWLSPGAPRVVSGPSWDAALVRCASWAKFHDKANSKVFWVFNAHFDHVGAISRDSSASLILTEIRRMAGSDPLVLTGDLNADQNSSMYKTLNESGVLQESWEAAIRKEPVSRTTFNSWKTDPEENRQIDHIFISPHWQVLKRKVIWDNYKGVLPSDHFPVMVSILLR